MNLVAGQRANIANNINEASHVHDNIHVLLWIARLRNSLEFYQPVYHISSIFNQISMQE